MRSGVWAEVYEVEWCSVFDSCDVVGEPAEFAETEGFTGFEKFLVEIDDVLGWCDEFESGFAGGVVSYYDDLIAIEI